MTPHTPGKIISIGYHRYGWDIFLFGQCVDCDTQYRADVEHPGHWLVNGSSVEVCPFCREDSKPWLNGRGL